MFIHRKANKVLSQGVDCRYALSKTLSEQAAFEFAASADLPLATIQPPLILGASNQLQPAALTMLQPAALTVLQPAAVVTVLLWAAVLTGGW